MTTTLSTEAKRALVRAQMQDELKRIEHLTELHHKIDTELTEAVHLFMSYRQSLSILGG
jgi:hypothetical protein